MGGGGGGGRGGGGDELNGNLIQFDCCTVTVCLVLKATISERKGLNKTH